MIYRAGAPAALRFLQPRGRFNIIVHGLQKLTWIKNEPLELSHRDHIVTSEASLRDIMTVPPASAEAYTAQRQRQMQTRLRLEELRDERELEADRGWH